MPWPSWTLRCWLWRSAHSDLLAFFEWDAKEKLSQRAQPWADMDRVPEPSFASWTEMLKEYSPVHPMAAVRSEEAQRGPRRAEMQEKIDEALAEFEALEVRTPAPPPAIEAIGRAYGGDSGASDIGRGTGFAAG